MNTTSDVWPEADAQDELLAAAERRLAARRRGFWWGLAAIGGYFLFLVIVRLVWGVIAEQRLEARIAEYRAAGQPVRIEDFPIVAVDDANNAALLYDEAVATMPQIWNVDDSTLLEYSWRRREWEQASGLISEYLVRFTDSLALLSKASGRTEVDWGERPTSPLVLSRPGQYSGYRTLAKTLVIAGLDAHYRGDDQRAMELLFDTQLLGDRLIENRHSTIGYLVSDAIQGLLFKAIEMQGHTLDLSKATEARRVAKSLVAQLLETSNQSQFAEIVYWDSLVFVDTCETVARHPSQFIASGMMTFAAAPNLQSYAWVLGPATLLEAEVAMKEYKQFATTPFAQAPEAFSIALAKIVYGATKQFSQAPLETILTRLVSSELVYENYTSIHMIAAHNETQRRMAAIALALRMYELDTGRWPVTLAELAPAYFPEVPVDPFDPNQAAIRFLPNVEQPRLYSVGVNRIDDQGVYEVYETGGLDIRQSPDMVWFLTDAQPFRPPDPNDSYSQLPKTLENDSEVQGADADDGETSDQEHTQEAEPEQAQGADG